MLELPVSDLAERYHRLVELSPDAILIHDDDHIIMANAAALRLAGAHDQQELIGHHITAFLNPPYLKGVADQLVRGDTSRRAPLVRDTFTRLDGSRVDVEVTAIPFLDGDRLCAHLVIRDISERLVEQAHTVQLRDRLAEAEKMEAIGVLAGGVAHEVNNMMVIVIGVSALLLDAAGLSDDQRGDIREIRRAGQRAAETTAQLLAFSRRAAHAAQQFDLDALVRQVERPTRELLGAGLTLEYRSAGPLQVEADPAQIAQVLILLAHNARDAMSAGGTLTITAEQVVVGKDGPGQAEGTLPPGAYAHLSVRDTGSGIEPAHLSRLFEPFFTTRTDGSAQGLGLAAAWGIMAQNAGSITIASVVGEGTVVDLFLPLHEVAYQRRPFVTSGPAQTPRRRGQVTILVVDDEPDVIRFIARLLERRGFMVRLASGGAESLAMVARDGPPDLVLTDLMMPETGGAELARRLGAEWPDLPVIFMSGYSTDEPAANWGIDPAAWRIQKPFTLEELMLVVDRALASTGADVVPPHA